MSERVAVGCTHCGTQYALPTEFLGKRATCKKCGQKFVAQLPVVPPRNVPASASSTVLPPRPAAAPPPQTRPVPASTNPADPLEDSVLAWLNGPDDDESPAPIQADRPRVVTTAQLCDPSQRLNTKRRGTVQSAPSEQTSGAVGGSH